MNNKIIKYIERPLAEEQRNTVFVKGRVSVHEKFKQFIEPGGMLHVRFVSLRLKRAVIFKQYDNVSFPFDYEILGSDVLIPSRFKDTLNYDFYIEAIYMPPGKDYRDRPYCPGGEAWGKAGKLYPLKAGDEADIQISFFWTPELFKGELKKENGAVNAMWLDIQDKLKYLIPIKNKLTVYLKTTEDDNVNKEIIVAKKSIEDIRAEDLPLALNFYQDDFQIPLTNKLRVYYQAILEPVGQNDEFYLYGLRASPWVKISPRVQSLRLVLFMKSQDYPDFNKEIYELNQ